ncbi:hypothetical protein GWK47_050423 [Chionoecetes opilio]|uniref:Uncharacterized protein n=1 Tax=Chionoecetes opilio TaxID=41210 RepID=A0A8J4Y8D0_CHIOP|nr:hypothetical protein GWK47_050423 [Chionoecetes opilio]
MKEVQSFFALLSHVISWRRERKRKKEEEEWELNCAVIPASSATAILSLSQTLAIIRFHPRIPQSSWYPSSSPTFPEQPRGTLPILLSSIHYVHPENPSVFMLSSPWHPPPRCHFVLILTSPTYIWVHGHVPLMSYARRRPRPPGITWDALKCQQLVFEGRSWPSVFDLPACTPTCPPESVSRSKLCVWWIEH